MIRLNQFRTVHTNSRENWYYKINGITRINGYNDACYLNIDRLENIYYFVAGAYKTYDTIL